jgi:hypothetical protein
MSKPWHEMTPAERMADRIAKNRAIDERVSHKVVPVNNKAASEIHTRQKAVRNVLDKFQQIKATQGLDAASEYVRSRKNSVT